MDQQRRGHRTITIEEHFAVAAVQEQTRRVAARTGVAPWGLFPDDIFTLLAETGAARIADLDASGVDVQLISLASPGIHTFDAATAAALARDVNDVAGELVRAHGGRIAAMAVVAPHAPDVAAAELERALGLGLTGLVVNGHVHGRYLDDPEFRPLLEAAAALHVPIFLHPRETPPGMDCYAEIPGFSGWITGVEESTHAMRIVRAGILDDHPELQFVLGHLGGGIPFVLPRLDNRYVEALGHGAEALAELPSHYFTHNFSYGTSGMLHEPQVRFCIDAVGVDRVLLATDYPLEDMLTATQAFERMALTAPEREAIASGNAERLWRL